ncbi:MAG: LIC12162 family protein [Gallionellaceae bacterium]
MVKRFLITTALEETWRDDEPVVFLGEWCRRYSRTDRWSKMDAEAMPYHWDDRAKMFADYQYLQDFHERLLQNLTAQLNQIHNVDHSLRYWRILIGPWLGYFVQMLFDRWSSIQQAATQYDLSETIVLAGQAEALVPNDMDDFTRLFVSDEWNHHLYSTILKRFTAVSCSTRVRKSVDVLVKAAPEIPSWKRRASQTLAGWYGHVASILTQDSDAFFLSTYLPWRDEMLLYRRFGQMPQLRRSVQAVQVAVDDSQRLWSVAGDSRNEFEICARALIPLQIPTLYLEGYGKLIGQVAGLRWPKHPKLIWTSNAHLSDDVFKAWAAGKVETGSPLVIGQHGGHYGIGRWSFVEDHDTAIGDCYLSWGWSEPGQPKVKPFGQLKAKRPLGIQHGGQSGALLVGCTIPQYSYFMFSAIVSRQWLDYFNDQSVFVGELPAHIRNSLTVRMYAHDYGWGQAMRWHERFPGLHLDDGRSNINDLICQSRLYISTYNATTFLESFTMDVPTVIFWNPSQWELRDSATPYFEELKRVGIFHETPASAAFHVATIWDDVSGWWYSNQVQSVLKAFCHRYSRISERPLDELEQVLYRLTQSAAEEQK